MAKQTTENKKSSPANSEVFEAFPAPRVWQFGGDMWAGLPHQKDTSDFLPSSPPAIQIEISISNDVRLQ